MNLRSNDSPTVTAQAIACLAAAVLLAAGSILATSIKANATTTPTVANINLGLSYAAHEAQNYGMAPSPATTSRYMSTTDSGVTYNEGCAQGAAKESGELILEFGKPWFDGTNYGTIAFDGSFHSTNDIENAVLGFANGYWNCSGPQPFAAILIGTSNCYLDQNCHYAGEPDYTNFAHGQAWDKLVSDTYNIISAEGWNKQESIHGASDMELDWNYASTTEDWAHGFSSNCCGTYYDIGDAAGCPPLGSCDNGWTQEDLYQVTWGIAAAYAIPEVYTTNGSQANEWYRNSLYGYTAHGFRVPYFASLTQWNALRRCTCTNTPDAGNSQLNRSLNADTNTKQTVIDETDITWAN